MFREFLKSEYSEENMLFWLAIEEYRQIEDVKVREERARIIYEDYISILSPKEVLHGVFLNSFSISSFDTNVIVPDFNPNLTFIYILGLALKSS